MCPIIQLIGRTMSQGENGWKHVRHIVTARDCDSLYRLYSFAMRSPCVVTAYSRGWLSILVSQEFKDRWACLMKVKGTRAYCMIGAFSRLYPPYSSIRRGSLFSCQVERWKNPHQQPYFRDGRIGAVLGRRVIMHSKNFFPPKRVDHGEEASFTLSRTRLVWYTRVQAERV